MSDSPTPAVKTTEEVARVDSLSRERSGATTAPADGSASTVALPWRVDRGYVLDSRGSVISVVGELMEEGPYLDRRDAEFIVRACNSHADLVLALRCFIDRYVGLVNCGDCGNWNPEDDVEVIRARAALAKAEFTHE